MSVSNPQLLIEQLESELLSTQSQLQSKQNELKWAYLKIQVLEERLRQNRIRMLGPQSETLNNLQLELLAEEEPGATSDEVAAEGKREPLTRKPARERKPHPGRGPLPENLPRVEKVIACQDKTCGKCGHETAVIGYDTSEQLDVEPARYLVRVIKREKRVCRDCEQSPVTMPPLEPRIVEKGVASDRVVIETVVAKYCDHLPLYRQALILEREAGLEIGRATLDGWVMRVGELLIPVVGAMRQDLLKSGYLQADETTVPVQMHDGRGKNHEAYLWQYGRPGGETVFDFCLHRGREGPKHFLEKWEGILQTDGYQAYDGVGGEKLVHVGCWAHYLDSGIIWSCLRQCPMQTAPDRRSLQIIPLMARPADPSNGYEPSDPLQRRPRASGGRVVAEEPPFSRVDDRLPAMDPALPYLLSTA